MKKNILVVGASIAGLTSAYWLAQYGFSVTLVEISDGLSSGGQLIDIRGSGLDVIERMGILERIREYKTNFLGFNRVNAAGEEIFRSEEYTPSGSRFDTPDIEILRDDLVAVLADITLVNPAIRIHYADTVEAINSGKSDVTVRFRSGREEQYWAVLGADGINSRVRTLIHPEEVQLLPVANERFAIWSMPNFSNLKRWQTYFDPTEDVSFGVMTVRDDSELRVLVSYPSPDEHYRSQQEWKDYTKNILQEYPGWINAELSESLDHCTNFYSSIPSQVRLSAWNQSRVALVGDAAYCPSPYSGQGTSVALTGAYVLAGELSQYHDHNDPCAAFAVYEAELKVFIENNQAIPFLGEDPRYSDNPQIQAKWLQAQSGYVIKDYSDRRQAS